MHIFMLLFVVYANLSLGDCEVLTLQVLSSLRYTPMSPLISLRLRSLNLIEMNALSGFFALKYLDLSYNNLTSLQTAVFGSVSSLDS